MNIINKIVNIIKIGFKDPLKDPKCYGCSHVDGPLCPYPKECECMLDSLLKYKKISDVTIKDIPSPIDEVVETYKWNIEHQEDINDTLSRGYWLLVYSHPYYKDKWTYEYYNLNNNSWASLGSNTIFSSGHLFPCETTKENAWKKGIEQIKSISQPKNKEIIDNYILSTN